MEDVYGNIDLKSIETKEVEVEYVHECVENRVVIIALVSFEVVVEYSVRDEKSSYYNKEEHRYYWENFIKYRNKFWTSKEIEILLLINEDELSVSVDIDDIAMDTNIYLQERDLIDSIAIGETLHDCEEDLDPSTSYCPDCGKKMTLKILFERMNSI